VWFYRKYLKGLTQSAWTTDGIEVQLSGCAGCNTSVSGMGADKERAQQWMASKLEYKGENPVEHEIIDDVTGMDLRRSGEFAKVLQSAYGQAVSHEHVPWNGIGRPEW
jgi:hypothetical protein